MKDREFILVAHTSLPPKERLLHYIDQIYQNSIVTNNGPLVKDFEQKLKEVLGVRFALFVNSGHTALMMAIHGLKSKGKILTTPFSFISTLQSILWNDCQPIFADIETLTLSIDPNRVEDVLMKGDRYEAIVATHLLGNICDVEALEYLSTKYSVPIIYDAAHSFGIQYKEASIFNYGDVSALSFQAYKVLNTVEGGALLTHHSQLYEDLFNMRYFGLDVQMTPYNVGLNGKNSEIHAAFGLCNLESWERDRSRRKEIYYQYVDFFTKYNWCFPKYREGIESNYSYFPLICKDEQERNQLEVFLLKNQIQSKRYFEPSLNTVFELGFDYQPMPISESISGRVLCIPLHANLSHEDIQYILSVFDSFQNR
ncbi:MAG: DegT/DnrJ/EryC1/StrS family aminotransferase [Chitinophagales bacterium]|nr:DegT/DnrJ/EryC1/StrS family aminotransferase [Chitinophagales bacterium]